MSKEKAFIGAGKVAGLELWRIENLTPVKLPANGKFHTGDSYILLATTQKTASSLAWAIHFWLGAETSHDEAGVAAYKTIELDDLLGGSPVQYREVQGSESSLFLSYFKHINGIEYLPGGVSSGFVHVEKDVYRTRLLHLKGKRTVCVKEVPLTSKSLNSGDVFIVDAGLRIFIFYGDHANKYEKAKGIDVATKINGEERGGRADIIIVNDSPEYNGEFWAALGGYINPATLPAGEDDDSDFSALPSKIFRVSDSTGSMQFTEIQTNGKLEKSSLRSYDVFIVSGKRNNQIYVWVGKSSTVAEKKEAFPAAIRFLGENNLPTSTPIERVSEGNESSAFKSEFAVWEQPKSFGFAPKSTSSSLSESKVTVENVLTRKAVEDEPVDDGSGKVKIWVINNFKKVDVPLKFYGQFHGGDSYILLYTYVVNGVENQIIYFWLGRTSTPDEKGAAALLAKELDDSLGGRPTQVRVVQGKEPPHFRQIFKGRMLIHSGGFASGFKNVKDTDSFDTDGIALFHVRGTNALNSTGVQVPETASEFNSEDTFVLVTPSTVFAWGGVSANVAEIAAADSYAVQLAGDYLGKGGRQVVSVKEGSEPGEFWAALGGKTPYAATSSDVQNAPRDPRLFQTSTATGRFNVEEILNFDQTDLNDEDVFILDTYTQLFVWIGTQSTQQEKTRALEFANQFVTEANDGRDLDAPIIQVNAGSEPSLFYRYFLGWDSEYFKKQIFADPYAERLKTLNAARLAKLGSDATFATASTSAKASSPAKAVAGSFSYEDLKSASVPAGVDPSRKEDYLDAATFMSLFGVDKDGFAVLPKWKRDAKKKELSLF